MRKLLGKQAKLVASRMFETLQEQLSLEVNDLGFSQEQLAQLRSLYKL